MFGDGPVYLPTSYTEEYNIVDEGEGNYNGEPYTKTEKYNHTLEFTLNDNGTIATEKRGYYNTIVFNYSNATRAAVIASQLETRLPMLDRMLFKHHRR
jgi:hypothetical protein